MQHAIDEYLKENSNIAANRKVKNMNPKSEDYQNQIDSRILTDTKSELYRKFPYANQISWATFLKYANINGEYKKPRR